MELYIRIKDGQPFEHPIFADNFREAFPDVDTNNLPPEFARFVRHQCPNDAGNYQVYDVSYAWVDGIVQDVWTLREMNDEERVEQTALLINNARYMVDSYKTKAQEILKVADTAATQAVNDFFGALDAWLANDPINLPMPVPPKISRSGSLMDVTASGSAPNVIG